MGFMNKEKELEQKMENCIQPPTSERRAMLELQQAYAVLEQKLIGKNRELLIKLLNAFTAWHSEDMYERGLLRD